MKDGLAIIMALPITLNVVLIGYGEIGMLGSVLVRTGMALITCIVNNMPKW